MTPRALPGVRVVVAAAQPTAEDVEAEHREQVEEDRRGVRGRQLVVEVAGVPRQRQLEGDVGVVVDRAVGVALGVVLGELALPPDGLAVGDPVGADDAGVADVDHAGCADVERDAEEQQEDQRRGQQPDRGAGAQPAIGAPTAKADPEHARQQIDQRRVGERNREVGVEVLVPKPGARDEAQQDEQIQMGDPSRPAEVEQAEYEHRRERKPQERL